MAHIVSRHSVSALVVVFALAALAFLAQESNALPTPMSLLMEPNMTGGRRYQQPARQATTGGLTRRNDSRADATRQYDAVSDSDSSSGGDTDPDIPSRANGTQIYNNSTQPSNTSSSTNVTSVTQNLNPALAAAALLPQTLLQIYNELKGIRLSNHTFDTRNSSIISNINGTSMLLPIAEAERTMSKKQSKAANITRPRFCSTMAETNMTINMQAIDLAKKQMQTYEKQTQVWLKKALVQLNTTSTASTSKRSSSDYSSLIESIGSGNNTHSPVVSMATSKFTKKELRSAVSMAVQAIIAEEKRYVPVVWNVIHNGSKGRLSETKIKKQMKELNAACEYDVAIVSHFGTILKTNHKFFSYVHPPQTTRQASNSTFLM